MAYFHGSTLLYCGFVVCDVRLRNNFHGPHFILGSVVVMQGCGYQNIQHVHDLACFLVLWAIVY